MGDLYAYTAMAGIGVIGLILPTLTFLLTRAWYVGSLEDRDAQIKRLDQHLKAADQIIAAAERKGFIRGDHGTREGRHEPR
ncbi:hypothetical protein [Streptomonospora wellingtoniae]|uniref:Uncharacterized protein n=1 Tax=Streptomonospora wellingtoniae TaxID=3075544 RepID=A0ABU2KUI8_9ACTN|nr:hypothetical protein [Streptomonospora sp. DSM 45055]MDT0302961.1 hypothetical protein [Streptomonospora sp. DSM 45055]